MKSSLSILLAAGLCLQVSAESSAPNEGLDQLTQAIDSMQSSVDKLAHEVLAERQQLGEPSIDALGKKNFDAFLKGALGQVEGETQLIEGLKKDILDAENKNGAFYLRWDATAVALTTTTVASGVTYAVYMDGLRLARQSKYFVVAQDGRIMGVEPATTVVSSPNDLRFRFVGEKRAQANHFSAEEFRQKFGYRFLSREELFAEFGKTATRRVTLPLPLRRKSLGLGLGTGLAVAALGAALYTLAFSVEDCNWFNLSAQCNRNQGIPLGLTAREIQQLSLKVTAAEGSLGVLNRMLGVLVKETEN